MNISSSRESAHLAGFWLATESAKRGSVSVRARESGRAGERRRVSKLICSRVTVCYCLPALGLHTCLSATLSIARPPHEPFNLPSLDTMCVCECVCECLVGFLIGQTLISLTVHRPRPGRAKPNQSCVQNRNNSQPTAGVRCSATSLGSAS